MKKQSPQCEKKLCPRCKNMADNIADFMCILKKISRYIEKPDRYGNNFKRAILNAKINFDEEIVL